MSLKKVEYNWLGRSLDNYKAQHVKAAESRGNKDAFLKCKTLTEARKLAYGHKKKNSR